jgi:hypothetical protein
MSGADAAGDRGALAGVARRRRRRAGPGRRRCGGRCGRACGRLFGATPGKIRTRRVCADCQRGAGLMDDFFARVEGRTHAWPPGRKDLHWLIVPGEDFARKHLYEPYCRLAFRVSLSH